MKNNQTCILTFIMSLIIGFTSNVNAQYHEVNFGVAMATLITGNATGVAYNPSAYLEVDKNLYHVGATFQSNNNNASGISAGIQRTFLHQSESFSGKTSLYIFSAVLYQHKASLSFKNQEKIKKLSPEYAGTESINYNIGEIHIGAGLKKHLSNRSAIDFNLGMGAYQTLKTNSPSQIPDAYNAIRSNNDLSLILKINYTFQLNKRII